MDLKFGIRKLDAPWPPNRSHAAPIYPLKNQGKAYAEISAYILRILCGYVLTCVFAVSGRADELYSFAFTRPTSGPQVDLIEGFSFDFTVPGIVTNGQAPAFTPFVVTDGIFQWTIAQDLADDCFMFGTVGVPFVEQGGLFGPCFVVGTGGGQVSGGFWVGFDNYLPSAPGTYAGSAGGDFFGNPSFDALGLGDDEPMVGTVELTITSTPEPPTGAGPVVILCVPIFMRFAQAKKRHAQRAKA